MTRNAEPRADRETSVEENDVPRLIPKAAAGGDVVLPPELHRRTRPVPRASGAIPHPGDHWSGAPLA